MSTYLPLLFLLACPVMMIFMMRGMNGGHDESSGAKRNTTATDPDPRDKRLADLEREVAGLRATRDHTEGSRP